MIVLLMDKRISSSSEIQLSNQFSEFSLLSFKYIEQCPKESKLHSCGKVKSQLQTHSILRQYSLGIHIISL